MNIYHLEPIEILLPSFVPETCNNLDLFDLFCNAEIRGAHYFDKYVRKSVPFNAA